MINLNQINRAAEVQTKQQAINSRRAYYLASNDCKKCRVSESRYWEALDCVRAFNLLNGLRDKSLEYDSLCTEAGEKISKIYDVKCSKAESKLNKLLKRFGYVVTWGTFAHVSPINDKLHQLF